jgi:signal peptidase I
LFWLGYLNDLILTLTHLSVLFKLLLFVSIFCEFEVEIVVVVSDTMQPQFLSEVFRKMDQARKTNLREL